MQELMDLLYAQIKHGDNEHQEWLRNKLDEFVIQYEEEYSVIHVSDFDGE